MSKTLIDRLYIYEKYNIHLDNMKATEISELIDLLVEEMAYRIDNPNGSSNPEAKIMTHLKPTTNTGSEE